MKKIALIVAGCFCFSFAFSQDTTLLSNVAPVKTANDNKLPVTKRAADHLMFQLSSDHWLSAPDSISNHTTGLSRGFNAYFMFDKQFKSSPKFSIAAGVGVSTSNVFFSNLNIDLKSNTATLPFINVDSTQHFKKYKVATTYLEIPLEFRYTSKPQEPNKSFKMALGLKAGTLVNAHTKGKTLLDKNNNTISSYVEKENSKRFLNGTRFMGTARVGYGIISVFGSYQLNGILKDGVGPSDMRLMQVGLTISGL